MKNLFLVFVLLFACSTLYAQETITVNKEDLPKDLLEKIELENKVETYGSWIGLGKEIGTAVDSSLSALTENSVKLSETDIGKTAIFIVVWKLLWIDILQLIVGFILLIVVTGFSVHIYKTAIKPQNVIVSERGDSKEYEMKSPIAKYDSAGALFAFGCFVCGAYIGCCIIMFAF